MHKTDDKSLNIRNLSEPSDTGQGLLVLSQKRDIMGCNTALETFLKRSLVPGEHFSLEGFFGESCLKRAREVLSGVLAREKRYAWIDCRLCPGNGGRISCSYCADPLFDAGGRAIGVIFNFRFIPSPCRPPGMSRHLPQVDFRTLFEKLPEAAFTINTNWRITSFNMTAEKSTGYLKADAIGRHCWDIFKSDSCRKNCPMARSLKSGKTCRDKEINILNFDGERHAIRISCSAIRDADGSILGAVETFRPPDPCAAPMEESQPNASPIEALQIGAPQAGPPHPGVFGHAPSNISKARFPQAQRDTFCGIIGKGPAMQSIFSMLPDIAKSSASVLICGENGTGKDLLASAIHRSSRRDKAPYVTVNCMALAESLLESELFGHEKGAFTGATAARPGRFEMAGDGTLFLDEIGDLKPSLQVKLLTVLEQKTFERVGGNRSIRLNARIISATNQDLDRLLEEGRFREDLYYRLRTVPVTLPPLRDRAEDIPMLVDHFIHDFNRKYGKEVRCCDPKVLRLFQGYHWPGNIRELARLMEHAFVFVKGPVIFPRYLPDLRDFYSPGKAGKTWSPEAADPNHRDTLVRALRRSGGRRKEAADLLGISRTSLWRKMKVHGLTRKSADSKGLAESPGIHVFP